MTHTHTLRWSLLALSCLAVAGIAAHMTPLDAWGQQAPARRTGTIRGRVELRPTLAAPVQRPNVSDLGGPDRRDTAEHTQAVVYLETAPRGAFEQPNPGRATMDQRNETFVPHVLAITTGTVVAFPNSDRIYHNVFSLSKPSRFDLGRYATGKSKSVRFDRAGIVRVFCDIHSHMNAFILVFSHPFFAVTDEDGRFTIEGVPPGTYTLSAWSDRGSFDSKSITVAASGDTQADFAPK